MTDSGASGPAVNPSPFDLPGRGRAAALCLHGLTGTPYEVRPLGEAIAAVGIRAVGPALPGHNETPDRLASTPYTDWLEAARSEYHRLREDFESVAIVGLSMGGLLALAIAEEEPVDALVTIGTPLVLHHPLAWMVPLIKYLRPMSAKTEGSDIRDPAARARHAGYRVMPLNSVHELQRLQRRVRPQLGRITAPILVAHGVHDRTASPRDAVEIRDSVSSEVREYLLLAASGHVVPVDFDGPALAQATAEFLARHT
ncbi:MAG: alpha/beta fold hydrolase [Deltaproteobacteria bacterium]|nr:alpha/beta fold hydrolase [Deltaproteobacteria bacterium]